MPNVETADIDTIVNCSCHFALPSSAYQHTPLGLGYLGNQAMMRRGNRAPLAPFSIAADIVYISVSILDFGLCQLCKQIEIVQNICIFRRFAWIISVMRFGIGIATWDLWAVGSCHAACGMRQVQSGKWQCKCNSCICSWQSWRLLDDAKWNQAECFGCVGAAAALVSLEWAWHGLLRMRLAASGARLEARGKAGTCGLVHIYFNGNGSNSV